MSESQIAVPQIEPWLSGHELELVSSVIRSGWLTEGIHSEKFTKALLTLMDSPYGVMAPNGTLALALGLMALGIKDGDHVIVPDSTFFGSASAVVLSGAIPIFVDVDPVNFQIDCDKFASAITWKTRAVMPVHMMGTSCDMTRIEQICKSHNLMMIEDACQGIGVKYRSKHVGTFGDVGCFSFFADKTITTGEGGFVVCKDESIYRKLKLLRNQGRQHSGTFDHSSIGYNFRMTDMQCAVGLAQMDRLEQIVSRKKKLLETYKEGFKDISFVRVVDAAPDANIVPFRCLIEASQRDNLAEHLKSHGVQPRNFFRPMHSQKPFRNGISQGEFPVADHAADSCLCLPIFPTMSESQIHLVIDLVRNFYQ